MALRSNNRRRGLMAEINVVPYIDVMLVLVVILMVAAPFVNPSLIRSRTDTVLGSKRKLSTCAGAAFLLTASTCGSCTDSTVTA